MINKKNVLGKVPAELGVKDAIHTAIVSVRAAQTIEPGQKCLMNNFNEAEPSAKGIGVADPFRKTNIARGENFWLILNQDEIPNVQHVWNHPTVDFSAPTREVVYPKYLQEDADTLGVTYHQLMEAATHVVETYRSAIYPSNGKLKTQEELDEAYIDNYEFWSEWSGETGYEFENMGSDCCPEYNYPDTPLFFIPE